MSHIIRLEEKIRSAISSELQVHPHCFSIKIETETALDIPTENSRVLVIKAVVPIQEEFN